MRGLLDIEDIEKKPSNPSGLCVFLTNKPKKNNEKIEFEIGQDFYTATGGGRCTDIGTCVIVAIQLNQEDSRNYNGLPYSIIEYVFDEIHNAYMFLITHKSQQLYDKNGVK